MRGERRIVMDRSACTSKEANYHSVEFFVEGIDFPYQFRIWETDKKSMSVLVKSDSVILPRLRVGDIFDLKYYPDDSTYPSKNIPTAIRYVNKESQGRLKGHSLVGLEIIET